MTTTRLSRALLQGLHRAAVKPSRTRLLLSSPFSTKRIQPKPIEEETGCVRVDFAFVERLSGDKISVSGVVGKTVLDVALDNNVDIEGACGGELACSTCHVIVEQKLYGKLVPKKVEEEDMLDLAQGLCETSRLCCQLKVTPDLQGAVFTVPNETI